MTAAELLNAGVTETIYREFERDLCRRAWPTANLAMDVPKTP
jgi:hypothetical protein